MLISRPLIVIIFWGEYPEHNYCMKINNHYLQFILSSSGNPSVVSLSGQESCKIITPFPLYSYKEQTLNFVYNIDLWQNMIF